MGYKIEPRCMSCVYREYPYVGQGITARYFVLDEATNEVLAGNNGLGYKTYNKAYLAYQWMLKGPAAARAYKIEQEMMYEWSLNNKILLDRLYSIEYRYREEGKELTAKHIRVLFNTQRAQCPTTYEAFLLAYQNDFYKDIILKRREQAKKKAEIKAKWDIKKKTDDFIDSHHNLAMLREQFSPERRAKFFAPFKKLLLDSMKDYEERPLDISAKDRLNASRVCTVGEVYHTGQPFKNHEWEIVEPDANSSTIYDTFGQQAAHELDRRMPREAMHPAELRGRLSTQMMVDPITFQIVPVRSSRCTNEQEWKQMAAGAKKKKKRLAAIEPIADLDGLYDDIFEFDDDIEENEISMRTIQTEPAVKKRPPVVTTTSDWVGVSEEQMVNLNPPPKPKPSRPARPQEPTSANASMSMGNKRKKNERVRPEGLPPKKEVPKKSLKENLQEKVNQFKEDWTFDDELDDGEEYEIPTFNDVMNNIKTSINGFFAAVKQEADKQKAEETAQREAKKKIKPAKQTDNDYTFEELDSSSTKELIPQQETDELDEFAVSLSLGADTTDNPPMDDELINQIINEVINESEDDTTSL